MRIIIGTTNFNSLVCTKIWLKTLQRSIFKAYDKGLDWDIKVVIIDNSTEEDQKITKSLELQYPIYKFIKNNGNIGCAAAWNQIIKEGYSDGQYQYSWYMPTNNDLYFTEDWVFNFI